MSRKAKKHEQKRFNLLQLIIIAMILGGSTFLIYDRMQDHQTPDTVEIESLSVFGEQPPYSDSFDFEVGAWTHIDGSLAAADHIKASHMQWVATRVVFDPDRQEQLIWGLEQITVAHEHDLKIMLDVSPLLHTFTYDDTVTLTDAYIEDYLNWLSVLAAGGADAIMVWQYGNSPISFPQDDDGSDYGELLERSASIIREMSPHTRVIAGAPLDVNGRQPGGEGFNENNFLSNLLTEGYLDDVDCVGMNYSWGTVHPLQTGSDTRLEPAHIKYLPDRLQHYREALQADVPICLTMFGYYSQEWMTTDGHPIEGSTVSTEYQIQWVADGLQWLSLQVDVPLVIVTRMDNDEHDRSLSATGYNLLFNPQNPE